MLIALDTSTALASIALATEDALLAELTWSVGQRHGSELTQRLDELLRAHGLTMADAAMGIAVATGPGSFNGARVAVATAKALALALGVPLYAYSTLDVIAWGVRLTHGPIWALLDAGRGEVYAAEYTSRYNIEYGKAAAHWAPVGGVENGYLILSPAELVERVQEQSASGSDGRERVVFCGEWRKETLVALMAALGERAFFASPLSTRRAASLAELALARMVTQSEPDDPATVEPLYLRRPSITTSARHRNIPSSAQATMQESAAQPELSQRVDLAIYPQQIQQPGEQGNEHTTPSGQTSQSSQHGARDHQRDLARRGKHAPGGEGAARALHG